jgi:S1-C subfamily serine protease
MKTETALLATALTLMAALAGAPLRALAAPLDMVSCYDAARDMVTLKRRDACRGQVVSPQEADAIRARRREQVRRSMQPAAGTPAPGHRLARLGTGFFVSKDGAVVTNNHVVDGCGAITVAPHDGARIAAVRAGRDTINDLALLRTTGPAPAVAAFLDGEKAPRQGMVAIVGFPNHGLAPIIPMLTPGRIIDTGALSNDSRIRLKAPVRPGNSGGPVLDRAGRVLGIISSQADTVRIYAATGIAVRDIGNAIALGPLTRFLARHAITPRRAKATMNAVSPDDDAALLAAATRYIVRVGCWR